MSANAQNWLLQLAYDGRHYKGWQIQKDALTVQGELHKALQNLYPELDEVQSWGCSRTDAGVHALAQMVTFIPPESPPIPMNKVQLALNNRLPEDIRVVAISAQEADFHARHKACGKAYTYVLHQGSLDFPFMKPW